MPGRVLTTGSQVKCPHGGSAILTTANAKVRAASGYVLLQSDVHPVAGCAFTIGTKPSPCIRIEWSAGAAQVSVGGQPPLVESSIGTCYSPESAPQGVALIVSAEPKVSAR
jgi:hypothetical protein